MRRYCLHCMEYVDDLEEHRKTKKHKRWYSKKGYEAFITEEDIHEPRTVHKPNT